MAGRVGVGRLTVIRTEQCLFNEIPPTITKFLEAEGWGDLEQDYATYRQGIRRRAPEKLRPYVTQERESPLRAWRLYNDTSQVGACKILCVHLATWQKAEAGVTKSFPLQLVEALAEAEYPTRFVIDLQLAHESWTHARV